MSAPGHSRRGINISSFSKFSTSGKLDDPGKRDPQKNGDKHAADVYLLMAMMSPDEQEESRSYVEQFGQVPELGKIGAAVSELFGDPDRSGCRTIRNQYEGHINLPGFSAAILELFAPEGTA